MIADFLENAIIATSFSAHKNIMLTIGKMEDGYGFEIKDSGIPFEINTLNRLGIKSVTTHAGSGGSGIGYLKIFELLKETKASFYLYEETDIHAPYTKSMKVIFDGKQDMVLFSSRAKQVKHPKMRKQMTQKGTL